VKKHEVLRFFIIAAALVTIVMPSLSCSDSGSTNSFVQILSTIPDTPAARNQVLINDYAQMRKDFGINAPGTNATVDEQTQYLTSLSQMGSQTGFSQLHLATPPGSCITGGSQYLPYSLEAMLNLGLGYWSIDQEAEAGKPGSMGFILKGHFNTETTRQALAVSAKDDPPSIETYNGSTIFSWGGDNQINLIGRFNPPIYDALGRGGRFVVQNNFVLKTYDTAGIQDVLDAQKGKLASLADVTEFKLMAQELSSQGALTAIMTDRVQGLAYWTENEIVDLIKAQNEQTVKASDIDKYLAQGPKLLPYQTMAFAAAQDAKGLYALVIIVQADAQTAAQNVILLKQRIAETDSLITGQPWTSMISSSSITSHGRVLTAKLYGDSISRGWDYFYNVRDPLFLSK
jgi:hypothetical protein